MSWEREIRVEDGGEATARSLFRFGAPPSSSSGASCSTKGARLAPSPRAPHRREQCRHRAAPRVKPLFGALRSHYGNSNVLRLHTVIDSCSASSREGIVLGFPTTAPILLTDDLI